MNRFFVALVYVLFISSTALASHQNDNENDNDNGNHGESNEGGNGGQGGNGGNGTGGAGGNGTGGTAVAGQQQGQIGIVSSENTNRANSESNGTAVVDFDADLDVKTNTQDYNVNGQSQFGVNKNRTDIDSTNVGVNHLDNNIDNTDVNFVKGSEQSQVGINTQSGFNAQKQTSVGAVDVNSNDHFTVQGDTTVVEAPKIPVNSAAASIGGSCNQGVAFSNDNASFSAGTGNSVCDLLAVARGYAAIGDLDAARSTLVQAEKSARFRAFFGYIRTALTLGLL